MERVTGYAPAYSVWKTDALLLSYTRMRAEDGIRTRDPNLGKVVRYHCATSAWRLGPDSHGRDSVLQTDAYLLSHLATAVGVSLELTTSCLTDRRSAN